MAMVSKTATGATKYVTSSKLATGESVTGFYTGLLSSTRGYKPSIVLQSETGERIVVGPSGNLSYFDKDTAEGKYVIGQLTKITKTGTRLTKAGKTANVFDVAQDSEKILGSAPFSVQVTSGNTGGSATISVEDRLAALRGNSKKTA